MLRARVRRRMARAGRGTSRDASRGTTTACPSSDMEYKSRPKDTTVMERKPASQMPQVLIFSTRLEYSAFFPNRSCAIF